MDDLIKALQILRKYGNPVYPVNCSHGKLQVNIDADLVNNKDVNELDYLGFFKNEEPETGFSSYRFGYCK